MTIREKLFAAVIVGVLLAATAVFALALINHHQPEPAPQRVRVSLPEKCAPYYNDSTDQWAECMGVGPK